MKTNNKKVPIWLPYTSKIELKGNTVKFIYKGGEYAADINTILSILFYGSVCDLSEEFLQLCCRYRVPICIHRRNMPKAIWITSSTTTSTKGDILTKQILFKANKKKSTHIARKLLDAKFKSMDWLIPYPTKFLRAYYSIDEMRNIEAWHGRVYWEKYFSLLGLPEHNRRGADNNVKTILDAVSKLISGIILRYVTYHSLSPYHGFLHTPTEYPALIYDLVEPYRGYIDKTVFDTIRQAQEEKCEEKEIIGRCIAAVEHNLDETVYTDATRQIVTFQEILHGMVLALRSYLQNESAQLIVPVPGRPNGGRPVKAGYKLYGRSAGPTDFWVVAKELSQKHTQKMDSDLGTI